MIKSEFKHWISEILASTDFQMNPIQGDASFRAYYRIHHADKTYIAMLAPPDKEKTDAFVAIAKSWKSYGLQVPTVWAWQPQQGFALLSDFGDTLLLAVLNDKTAPGYYKRAMQTLLPLQIAKPSDYHLPPFIGAHARGELGLFDEWFVEKLLNISLSSKERNHFENIYELLLNSIQNQTQVVIHRDYHSRNLMVLHDNDLGVIDFQDAMIGPITYDLASLLKDCYIAWPENKIVAWVQDFYQMLKDKKRLEDVSLAEFIQWFDYVGLQRHLKVLGIFSRLKLRDNKPNYLKDMPRIMQYVLNVTARYPLLSEFDSWLRQMVLPILPEIMALHALSSDSKVA
jgi:aminoglycoside/choline kinase family phosphotransferase